MGVISGATNFKKTSKGEMIENHQTILENEHNECSMSIIDDEDLESYINGALVFHPYGEVTELIKVGV